MSVFDPLYSGVAHAIVGIHAGLEPIMGKTNGYGWALSIVLLTMGVRLILVPLFVKQIKSQRTMMVMQPKIKELREKHKNDRQKLNEEMMALQREHGNPILGCLPLLLQIPIFIAIFRVLRSIAPQLDAKTHMYTYVGRYGLTADQAHTIGTAKIFGVPLASSFRSSNAILQELGAHSIAATRIVAVIMIIIMCTTQFITQKQIQGSRPPGSSTPQTDMQMKLMLYFIPVSLAFTGFIFPIGSLVYYLTTNTWTMAQQLVVLRKMPPVYPVEETRGTTGRSGGSVATKPTAAKTSLAKRSLTSSRPRDVSPDHQLPRRKLAVERAPSVTPVSGAVSRPGGGAPKRNTNKRGNNKRKGGRRP